MAAASSLSTLAKIVDALEQFPDQLVEISLIL